MVNRTASKCLSDQCAIINGHALTHYVGGHGLKTAVVNAEPYIMAWSP